MATKTVTLKDSNGDTLYPVTDSNVVNINQQKTLAQALDGVVYAEDPTQNATPTAWVTSSDIDWTTMPGSYSTDEQKTPFTWVDGKPIYKKTFSFTTSGSSVATLVQHGISDLDVIVDYNGMLRQSSTNRQPIPRVVADNNSGYNIGVGDIGDTQFTFLVGTSVAKGVQAYVTLWYTKTTD